MYRRHWQSGRRMRDTEVENWSRNSRIRRSGGTSIYITTSLHPPRHSSSIIVSVLCGSMAERSPISPTFPICFLSDLLPTLSGLPDAFQYLTEPSCFGSFHRFLSFNSKTPYCYSCSTYSTWRKACSRSSYKSINKLRNLTLLKISFLPAILLYFGVMSRTLVGRHKRLGGYAG
jgi:hypothetical protein